MNLIERLKTVRDWTEDYCAADVAMASIVEIQSLQEQLTEANRHIDSAVQMVTSLTRKAIRLSAEVEELQAQLTWREYPAEKPEDSREPYMVLTNIHEKPQKRYWHPTEDRWTAFRDFSEGIIMDEVVLKWLPIPTTDTKEDLAGN